MNTWICLFFISCFLIFYNYGGYAALIILLNKLTSRSHNKYNSQTDYFPAVSFIVAVYNEEDCIEEKIHNSLGLNYPADKVEYIFVADGSTDRTVEIIKQHPRIRLLFAPERRGKSAAINKAVAAAKNPILIFSDANTKLNTNVILNIIRHYQDEGVGGVAGEKKVNTDTSAADKVGENEGLYWKYESFLKKTDSAFYSVVGAAGELFSVRKDYYEAIPEEVILDDFIISLKVAQKGFRIIYEPEAYATELPSFSLKDEQKRKIRIAAGAFQAMWLLRSLLLFWKNPRLSFLYISHRVLRWTITPICLLITFFSNAVLFFYSGSPLFYTLFAGQLLFYAAAIVGGFVSSRSRKWTILKIAHYFVFMNISVVKGFFRYIRGKQSASWEKAKRLPAS